MSEIDKIIGSNIRLYRRKHNITLVELAGYVGLTYQQIQKFESGENRISAYQLFNIANVPKINLNNFFKELTPLQSQNNNVFNRETKILLSIFSRISSKKDRKALIGIAKVLASKDL